MARNELFVCMAQLGLLLAFNLFGDFSKSVSDDAIQIIVVL